MAAEEEPKPIRRVERFLERLFAPGALGEGEGEGPEGAPDEGRPPQDPPRADAPGKRLTARPFAPELLPGGGPQRALLTVDDAGDFLLCAGREIVLGHARAGSADLPVLADVGPRHARFVLGASLAGGEEWQLQPLGTEKVFRNAEPVSTSTALAHGDELRLGRNLELVFQLPDPASATAVLAFRRGIDCLGASCVVLFAAGSGGRIRLGAAAGRHVRVPTLLAGAELVLDGQRLRVASPAGVSSGGARAPALELAFPPPARVDVVVGEPPPGGRAPFSFSLAPIPAGGAARRGEAS
jgi:hypothetical protein